MDAGGGESEASHFEQSGGFKFEAIQKRLGGDSKAIPDRSNIRKVNNFFVYLHHVDRGAILTNFILTTKKFLLAFCIFN